MTDKLTPAWTPILRSPTYPEGWTQLDLRAAGLDVSYAMPTGEYIVGHYAYRHHRPTVISARGETPANLLRRAQDAVVSVLRATLIEGLRAVEEVHPKCAICGQLATCRGQYEEADTVMDCDVGYEPPNAPPRAPPSASLARSLATSAPLTESDARKILADLGIDVDAEFKKMKVGLLARFVRDGGDTYACDDCCGHGCEDGPCAPLAP